MNLLIIGFAILAVAIFVFGLFSNNFIPSQSILPPIFFQLVRYGRANGSKTEKSNILKRIEVPKSWFAHFYLYCSLIQLYIFHTMVQIYIFNKDINESTGVLWFSKILDSTAGNSRPERISSSTTLLVSLLFLIQVTRRFYETRYVSVFSNTKMNIFHYVLGFVHYSGSTLSLIAHSPGFSTVSTSSHSNQITLDDVKSEWTTLVLHLFGIAVFIYGTIEQYNAHAAYANLRKKGNTVVTQTHKIPTGGLFELISCPNYWAEILIYFSFAIIFQFQNPCWNAVLLWVISNQVTAGIMNHIWYKEKFPEYPKNRKAVIPYLL